MIVSLAGSPPRRSPAGTPTGEANGRTSMYYTVYILRSNWDGNLYIGCTSNLEQRLKQHADGKVRSTKSRRPFALIYSEVYSDKYAAYKMERFYKTAKGKRELKKKINHCRLV